MTVTMQATPPPSAAIQIVGDRLVPSPIEVDFPGGTDGLPSLFMRIEVVDGVPRCTELTLRRSSEKGGREVRQKDLRMIELDSWVETFVAVFSSEITVNSGGRVTAVYSGDEESLRRVMKTIRNVRKGGRRPLTEERKRRVAELYNAHDQGGIEAVEIAFTVSRSTAARYIKAAREAGLIEKRVS